MQDKVLWYGQFEVGFTTVPSKTDEVGAPKVLRVPQEGNLKTDVSPMKLLRTVAYGLHKCRGQNERGATSPPFKPKKARSPYRSHLPPPVVKMHGSSGWMPQK